MFMYIIVEIFQFDKDRKEKKHHKVLMTMEHNSKEKQIVKIESQKKTKKYQNYSTIQWKAIVLTLGEMSSGYIVMQCHRDNCNAFNVVCNVAIKEREIK